MYNINTANLIIRNSGTIRPKSQSNHIFIQTRTVKCLRKYSKFNLKRHVITHHSYI